MKYSCSVEKKLPKRSDASPSKPFRKQGRVSVSDAHLMGHTTSGLTGQRLIDMSWLAGLIDGEGCFLFNSSPLITMDSTCRTVIEEAHKTLGGQCYAIKRLTAIGRPVFRWQIGGKKALEACTLLVPYLRDKKEQAFLLSKIYKYPPNSAMRACIRSRLKGLKRVSL
jgi:hypothetical protein